MTEGMTDGQRRRAGRSRRRRRAEGRTSTTQTTTAPTASAGGATAGGATAATEYSCCSCCCCSSCCSSCCMNLGNLTVSVCRFDLAGHRGDVGIRLPVWLAPPRSGLPPAPTGLSPCVVAASRSVWPQPSPPKQHPSILPGHVDCPRSSPRTSSPQPVRTSHPVAGPPPDPSPFLAQARLLAGSFTTRESSSSSVAVIVSRRTSRLEENTKPAHHTTLDFASPPPRSPSPPRTLPVFSGARRTPTQSRWPPIPPKAVRATVSKPRRRTRSLLTLKLEAVNNRRRCSTASLARSSPPACPGRNVAEHGPQTRRLALPTPAAEPKPAILAIARSTG